MQRNLITVTKEALKQLKRIQVEHKAKSILFGVSSGGCSGFEYLLEPTNNEPEKFDEQFIQDDISTSYRGVLRGIHGDENTTKLVSCLFGSF